MKNLIFAVIAATLLIACKKSEVLPAENHVKSPYRVLLFSNTNTDTAISSTMFARTETVGLVVAEDSKMKAELIAYDGHGVYRLMVTNKTTCQGIVRWGWDGLTIDSISPGSDVIPANSAIAFTLYGDHKEGRIKLKLESPCGNSSTLIINITTAILPVKILENIGSYDEKTGKTTIAFTVDDPAIFDWILIQRNDSYEWKQVLLIGCDHNTKSYSFKL